MAVEGRTLPFAWKGVIKLSCLSWIIVKVIKRKKLRTVGRK